MASTQILTSALDKSDTFKNTTWCSTNLLQDDDDPDEFDLFKNAMLESCRFDNKMENRILNDTIDGNDNIEKYLEKKVSVQVEKAAFNLCDICKIPCKISDGTMYCEKCGLSKDGNVDSQDKNFGAMNSDYGCSRGSFMPVRITGRGAYGPQKALLRACSDYTVYRKGKNEKDMRNYIYQYKGSKIPTNVIKLANEMFNKIKISGEVYRGKTKTAVMAGCLYYSCIMSRITRTPKEIATIFKIEDRFLSKGDRILHQLEEAKIITLPRNNNPLNDYADYYLPILKIPGKYRRFIIDLVNRAEYKNIHIINDSRPNTKCIGAIYMLVVRLRLEISKETIVKQCKISKSTFVRYYKLLMENGKILKKVFKQNCIPMPKEWRNI
jgi:transcription initiation factor TFIIIB Brf1 subunit/transcription initiation factor TFIIB